jgi:enoyl-CoA hydratase/carnithine racemase
VRRENKRNAVDRTRADAINGALRGLEDDPDLWAGILAGTPRVFSAGTDLTGGDTRPSAAASTASSAGDDVSP